MGRKAKKPEWFDPLKIYDRRHHETDALRGMLGGRSVFLVCGGPSAKALPLEQLNNRGAWSLGINNVCGHDRFRANAFLCSDPPSKFSDSIWLDPGIMKILPKPKLSPNSRGRLRTKLPPDQWIDPCPDCGGTGRQKPPRDDKHCDMCSAIGVVKFDWLKKGRWRATSQDSPNVWAFDRRSWLSPDDSFFTEPDAAWGNHNAGVIQTGQPKTVCTMLLGMRVLRYLGASRVYLVGVDFYMDPNKGLLENYSFAQERDADAIRSNNEQFAIVNRWLCQLADDGVFKKYGIEFYNCNPTSGLRSFPHVPFDKAIQDVCSGVAQKPDLGDWYIK